MQLAKTRGVGLVAVVALQAGGCRSDVVSTWGGGLPAMARSTGQVNSDCTIFDGDLKCWAMQEAALESELLLMMRDEPEPGAPLPEVELGTEAKVTSFAEFRSARCAALAGEGIKCWGRNDGHGSDYELYVLGQPDPTLVLGDDPQERGRGLPFVPLGATDAIAVVPRAAE